MKTQGKQIGGTVIYASKNPRQYWAYSNNDTNRVNWRMIEVQDDGILKVNSTSSSESIEQPTWEKIADALQPYWNEKDKSISHVDSQAEAFAALADF